MHLDGEIGLSHYMGDNFKNFSLIIIIKDKNIGNYWYIDPSILRIYWRYIDRYFDIKYQWA